MHKVSAKRQVTIPKELCEISDIRPGDVVDLFAYDERITVVEKESGVSSGVLRRFLSSFIPSCLPFRPSSVSNQQLHSTAMRLLSLLEDERKFGAIWYESLRQSPKVAESESDSGTTTSNLLFNQCYYTQPTLSERFRVGRLSLCQTVARHAYRARAQCGCPGGA